MLTRRLLSGICASVAFVLLASSAASAQSADLDVTNVDAPDPVVGGQNLTYTITVTNAGPDVAASVSLSDTLTAGTTFVSLSSPGGWSCTTPSVGAGGTVSCSQASMNVGSAVFTLTVNVSSLISGPLSNTASVTSATSDPTPGNDSATAVTTVNLPVTPIHDIQGPGATSPILGALVKIRGIVTGVTADGFFVQEEDAEVDADPATSEGIFVFTSSTPPVAADFSALVEVTGTVSEFAPSADPQDPPSTRLVSPTVTQIAPFGQPLPTEVPLTSTFPDPAGPFDQLERLEHMRVIVASLTVTGPTAGAVDEALATGSNNGRFYGALTGVSRPFREAGIQAPDVPPAGTIPPIPRWDSNPERIRVDSAGLTSQLPLSVKSGDVVTSLVGPLTYSERTYALLPDVTNPPSIVPGTLPTTVTAAAGNEVTVASINLRRFYDDVDDAGDDVVLSTTAYERRLAKASIAIRTHLLNPDIIGVQEIEKLTTLQALAARIATDGGPTYSAFLQEGTDPNGLDVGVLVKTTPVIGGVARVSGVTVTQQFPSTLWTDPADLLPKLAFDRPPLLVEATVNRTTTLGFPIMVLVTDLLGLEGIDSVAPVGLTTVGNRVRAQRLEQASLLAARIDDLQSTDAGERMVVLGGFNAFEVNDGYVDVMNTVMGTPTPDNETVVAGDGVDLVNTDLVNLVNTPPAAERYSQVFAGNARNVDHVLVNTGLVGLTTARRIEHPRIAADYPETHLDDDTTALRFSDRDPVVAYFESAALIVTDMQVTKVGAPNPVVPGQNLTYTITVTNAGPDAAASVALADTLPIGTAFVSLASPGGWSCTTPAVGAGGNVSCSLASMSVGSAVFTLTVTVSPVSAGTVSNAATVTTTTAEVTTSNNISISDTPIDGPPTITDITDQTIAEDGATAALPFTIGDVGTPAANLAVSVGSSNPLIVPTANIVLGGSGASRTVTVTPAANQHGGPVVITVTVGDGTFSTSDTFALTVTPVNDAPTIDPIADATVMANATIGPLPVIIGDIDDAAADLTLSATSSNQEIVTDAAITFGGSGASRTVTIVPLPDRGGTATITVTVNDGEATSSRTFQVNVILPALTYFLAEGATGDFFDEDLLIANPNASAAPITVTFYREGLPALTDTRTLPARSTARLHVDTLPGLEAAAVSVQVSSDSGRPLAVERTQFWGAGSYGGHTETALTAPATRWYFAEGAQGYFDTFVLVGNPQATPVDVTVTFLREGETPVTTSLEVAPLARATIPASSLPDLAGRSFGIIVAATQPVVAERAMYFGTTATRPWTGGAAAAGVTTASEHWYFAEGATGGFFDTFILLMNPHEFDMTLTLRYLLEDGQHIDVTKLLPARGRLTVNVESEADARLHAGAMSIMVTAPAAIVAERSIYWSTAEGALAWSESHTSQGALTAGPRWALAEGRSGGALNFHTYVLLANPGTQPATVTVEFLPDTGDPILRMYTVPAGRRFTIDVTADAPALDGQSFTTLISTTGDVPIVVERSMYWDGAGITWSGGTNALGTRLP